MSQMVVTSNDFIVAENLRSGSHVLHVFNNQEEFVAWRRLPENQSKTIVARNSARGRRLSFHEDHRGDFLNVETLDEKMSQIGIKKIELSADERRSFEVWDR